ncbi:MAG: Hsp20/alpha crystallin family protein [Candidatus Diapherotrites archaeon]|nr:Hsp20/alpha crystallin family protein [Candidatus Diapherotrites archaeon]
MVWDPFENMRRMMRRMFADFEDFDRSFSEEFRGEFRTPLADLWEDEQNYYASVELPGVSKEDIEIRAKDNGLEIKAVRKEKHEEKKRGLYHLERSYAGFYKFISLPSDADIKKAEASYKNGVLEIKIPKLAKSEDKSKRIEIK